MIARKRLLTVAAGAADAPELDEPSMRSRADRGTTANRWSVAVG